MHIKLFYSVLMVLFLSGAIMTAPAYAEKGGKGKGHGSEKSEQHYNDDHGRGDRHNDDDRGLLFSDEEARLVGDILKILYGGNYREDITIVRPDRSFCPPGLAKKNNGCMPPGQAKKYTIGSRLSDDVVLSDLPPELRKILGQPPHGYRYGQVDHDVLLITEGTRIVMDAIGLATR